MFCLYGVRRCSYLFIFVALASILYFNSYITVVIPFLLILYFFSSCSILPLFLNSPFYPFQHVDIFPNPFDVSFNSPLPPRHLALFPCSLFWTKLFSNIDTLCINEVVRFCNSSCWYLVYDLIDPVSNFFWLALVCLFEVDRIIAS